MAGIFQDGDSQIVFYDTPGIHQPHNKLSQYMLREVENVLDGADAALFLIDAKEGLGDEDYLVAEWLKKFEKPVLCLLNKIDQVPEGQGAGTYGKDQSGFGGGLAAFPHVRFVRQRSAGSYPSASDISAPPTSPFP